MYTPPYRNQHSIRVLFYSTLLAATLYPSTFSCACATSIVPNQNHREVDKVSKGASAAVRVEDGNGGSTLTYGRQFSAESGSLYSSITRETINALKANFRDKVRERTSLLAQARVVGFFSLFGSTMAFGLVP